MAASEWLICPACGLRHTPRSDGLCPRCRTPSESPEPDVPGAAWRPPPPASTPARRDAVTTGARLAGWALLVSGALGVVGALRVASQAGAHNTVAAAGALVGAGLGAAIAGGSALARRITIVLVSLALPALLALGAATGAWGPCGAGALVCIAYLVLLVGDPGPVRLVPAALVLAGGCAASLAAAAAPDAFAARILGWAGVVESEPVSSVSGAAWHMTFPPGRWYRTRARAGAGPAPEAGFVRPVGPAWATVLEVPARGASSLDPDLTARLGSEAVARQFDRWTLLETAPLPGRGATRVLHGIASRGGQEMEVLCGLFPNGPLFHVVSAGAAPAVFGKLRDELTGILASFGSDSLPMPPVPTRPAFPAAPAR